MGLRYESTITDWDSAIARHVQYGSKCLVNLFDWGVSHESVENLMASTSSYDNSSFGSSNSTSSSGSSSGSYGGCGGVYQLGNYSNAPDMQIVHQQTQSKEEVLNTLVGGSYTPDQIKKCAELITADKKKENKTQSKS